MPRQPSFQKVDQDEAEALEVVSAALLYTDMGVETRVPGSPRETFSVLVRNVLAGLWVTVLFGKTKVNNVDVVLPFAETHQKVIWLDIPMQV